MQLEARKLTKYYAAIPAVRDVSFTLAPGQILGLLGPNGSGKSTTVSILTGLIESSGGNVYFDGVDISRRPIEYKARIGYIPEEAHLYTFLSAREHLELIGRLRRLPGDLLARKIPALLDLFGLLAAADQPIRGYSKGMKQKVLIIAALLHDPDLLIFDEPESGLDLTAGLVLRHLIPILAERGKAILYCSHLLPVVEELCSTVIVLNRGAVAAQGPIDQLRTMLERSASLADVIAQLVVADNPEQRARDIADVASVQA